LLEAAGLDDEFGDQFDVPIELGAHAIARARRTAA